VLPRRYVAVLETAVHECGIKGAAPDDVLDAFAALWSADRIARGEAINLPAIPPRDSVGLRMEIVV
jgi:predicted RNase H-like nuclease